MVAKGDIAAQYEAAAAAAAAAAEGGVGERNMARSHSRGHPQEQRHSGGQQQQACGGGEGRAATNGHSVQHRLQAWVDGEDAPDVTTSGTNSVDEDYSYTSESDGTDDPPALKHHLPQAAPPPAAPPPAAEEAAIVPFWHSVRQRLQARVDGEDAPDVTTSSSTDNSVDEDYSKSESDGTDDPLALKHHLPQAAPPAPAAAVPFLTNAQIRELSVRIKNATGDERTSRAIVQRLADAGVGVRVTESLEGVEVYVDALTEEVKASRASDERERECFLYRDKQGRLFNLVVAGGAKEMALSWEASNSTYSGWMACAALPFLGRLLAYLIHMGSEDGNSVTQLAVLLFTVFGFVLHNEISHSWLNVSIHVLGTNSIGAHAWRSVVRTDHPRYAVLLLLSLAIFAPLRNSARGVLLGVGAIWGFLLLLVNLGARVWKKLNMDYLDGDKYRAMGSLAALLAAAIVGLTFPYVAMTRVVGGSSEDDRGATSRSRRVITAAATVSAIIFSLTGVEQISSALGTPLYNKGIINASVGLWWMMSSLVSLVACKRIQPSKYERGEVALQRNEASPVGWTVPCMPYIGLDPANRRQDVYPKKMSQLTGLISFIVIAGLGSYMIWRGYYFAFSEEHAVWGTARSSHGLIGLPTREPSDQPSIVPSVSMVPSSSPSLPPSVEPTLSGMPSSLPSQEPTMGPTGGPTADPTAPPTSRPTSRPTSSPSVAPSAEPSVTRSSSPSAMHSSAPSITASSSPSSRPSALPSTSPSSSPSRRPSSSPSDAPSVSPTSGPTPNPTDGPTHKPTKEPTKRPSESPSASPTMNPSQHPSPRPTDEPTESPTTSPTMSPTSSPSSQPSTSPSVSPTRSPSQLPSTSPTVTASSHPSTSPSNNPSKRPTMHPSPSPTTPPPTQRPSPGPTVSPTPPAPTTTPSASPSAGAVTVVLESKIFDLSLSTMSNYIDVGGVEHLNNALNEVTMSFLALPDPDVTEIDFATNLISQELTGGFLQVRLHRAAYLTVPNNGASGEYDHNLIPNKGIFDLVMLSIFATPSRKDEFLKVLHGKSDISAQNQRGVSQFEDVSHVQFLGMHNPPTPEPSPSPSALPSETVSEIPSSRPSQTPSLSFAPSASKITVNVQATPFELSLTFMSKTLDVAGMVALNDALNTIYPRMLDLANPTITSIKHYTLVVAQELSSPTLTIRILRSASISLPPLSGTSGQYDESLLPSVAELDEAMESMFASEALTREFVESLRKAVPTLFKYLIKVSWEGFYYPPTPSPSTMPSATPSVAPSAHPSMAPTTKPSSEPSGIPSLTHSAAPSSSPSLMHSAAPSSSPTTGSPTMSPSNRPSATPSSPPLTIEMKAKPFDLSLGELSSYMGVGSLSRFTDVLDEMVEDGLELDPRISVSFSSLLLSQSLGSFSLRIRVLRTTYVTAPAVGGPGMYDDEDIVPDESAIEAVIAEIFTSPTLNGLFVEKLQADPYIFEYRYLDGITFLGFVAPPTQRPTMTPSDVPSPTPSDMPSSAPTDAPTPIPTSTPVSEAPVSVPPTSAPVVPTAVPDLEKSVEEKLLTVPIKSPSESNGDASVISWTISQSGQDADGGWVVSEDGLGLRFNVEASDFCHGGTNMNTQKGKAVATIEVATETKLYFVLGGQGESLDTGYEQMSLTVDRVLVASSTSRAIGMECAPNPVLVTYFKESPYLLSPGWHTFAVEFTTADDFDHYGTFWTVHFSLEEA